MATSSPATSSEGGVATSAAERRALKAHQLGAPTPPVDQPQLPCPRCTSANTKFCYYNNYNFSQPRHFCKACRRYWTHGGTLRDVPVGGGTRKAVKRPRRDNTSSASSPLFTPLSGTTSNIITTTSANTSVIPLLDHQPLSAVPVVSGGTGGFTGLLALGGFGLGLGLEDVHGLGLGRGVWATFPHHHDVGNYGCGGGMNLNCGEEDSYGIGDQGGFGNGGGGECFSSMAPELAISTTGNGLK